MDELFSEKVQTKLLYIKKKQKKTKHDNLISNCESWYNNMKTINHSLLIGYFAKQLLHNPIPQWDLLAIFLYINIELANKLPMRKCLTLSNNKDEKNVALPVYCCWQKCCSAKELTIYHDKSVILSGFKTLSYSLVEDYKYFTNFIIISHLLSEFLS